MLFILETDEIALFVFGGRNLAPSLIILIFNVTTLINQMNSNYFLIGNNNFVNK